MFLETTSRETLRFIIRVMRIKEIKNVQTHNLNSLLPLSFSIVVTGETKSLFLIAIVAVSMLEKDRFTIESTSMAFLLRISLVQVQRPDDVISMPKYVCFSTLC